MKRIIALDYGQRRIGVAISDALGLTAQPLETWQNTGWDAVIANILKIDTSMGVGRVIVGLPLTMRGKHGKMARETERFVKKLRQGLQLPVASWDERLTSVQAKRILLHAGKSVRRNKSNVDSMAAVLLLQNYLDHKANNADPPAEEL